MLEKLLARMPDVLSATGYSKTNLHYQIVGGTFPRPVKLSAQGRAVAFPVHEVHAVIKARIAGRTDDQVRALVKHLHSIRTEEL